MRIRNLRPYTLFFPYGAPERGYPIKPKALGPELPSDRFFNKLLQRDWHNGTIELVFNEMDKATLGPVITRTAKVQTDAHQDIPTVIAISQPPETTAPAPAPAPASEPQPEPPAPETPAQPDDTPEMPAPTPDEAKADKIRAESNDVHIPPGVLQPNQHCVKCGKTHNVMVDNRVNMLLCKYCRRSITRGSATVTGLIPGKEDDVPEPVVAPPGVPAMVEEVLARKPQGPLPKPRSLADLARENSQLSKGPQ